MEEINGDEPSDSNYEEYLNNDKDFDLSPVSVDYRPDLANFDLQSLEVEFSNLEYQLEII